MRLHHRPNVPKRSRGGRASAPRGDRSPSTPTAEALPACGTGRPGGFSRRHYRPTGQRARTPLVRAGPGLTASPLNRTDTRAGSDPPSSRRAASIAGASTVTSRCHLHGSEAEEPARPKR